MKVLVSACLLGVSCRYDGQSKAYPLVEELCRRHEVVPMCPEQLGGLPAPRTPAERQGGRVVTKTGGDVTEQYLRGAAEVVRLARLLGCSVAVLKERSPSCGSGTVYDGTFTGTLTDGFGTAAEALRAADIRVLGESQLAAFLAENETAF